MMVGWLTPPLNNRPHQAFIQEPHNPISLKASGFILLCLLFGACGSTNHIFFDIPAGKAEKTLEEFVVQSSVEVVYERREVEGVRTNPVYGKMSKVEALKTMLAGTNLELSVDPPSGAIAIHPK